MRNIFKKERENKDQDHVAIENLELDGIIPGLELATQISLGIIGGDSPSNALERMAKLVQRRLPFDQMAVFTRREDGMLEPAFAKSSKSTSPSMETDQSWGDTMARKAVDGGKAVVREKQEQDPTSDLRQTLSVPLKLADKMTGALVLIRYKGPPFNIAELNLANFLGSQVLQIINQQKLADQLTDLEAKKHITILQDEFIALISHELLTPLGFIKGYATTLLRDDVDWDEETQKEFLSIIDEEADRLRQIIEDLLDSSKLRAGSLEINFQPIKLDSFIKDISLRARTRDAQLDLSVIIERSGMSISGDSTRLAQVFDNLFSNASKYANNSPVKLVVDNFQDHARIIFSDNGPGIPSSRIDELFTRFYRVPESSNTVRGSGLGLYICKHIIEAHNGEISVESSPGEGTTFKILLPTIDQIEAFE